MITYVETETVLANDLRVTHEVSGGIHSVKLYDADDYDEFRLGEDEIKSLHKYLGELIEKEKL